METEDLLVERLVNRIEEANTYFLMKMGSSIKKIRNLTPSQAQQLVQILKYGESYDEIIAEISKYTGMNIKELDEIFSLYAQKDRQFYEKFYKYRNIPFEESLALKTQRKALTRLAVNEMYDFTRSNVLGYTIDGRFLSLRGTYNKLLDTALLNVGQGKETFDSAMTRILKDIGGSGLRTINYASGRSMRLDSAVRMNLKSRLRELHNENQRIIGEEIGADGVEISVHSNPAPDHEEAQGRQFSNEEYAKLNSGLEATDYKGKKITLDHDDKNGYRPISELNCYHYIFSIILGVSEPEYTNKQLQQIINENNKGFELDGQHYTNYEGTQMQRQLERKIREQKDIQILAKSSDNMELVGESQQKITQLTNKYKELSGVSGLPTKMERMRVSGYRRTKVNTPKNIDNFDRPLNNIDDIAKYVNYRKNDLYGLDVKENQLKLNEKYNYNDKPSLINANDFDKLEEIDNYNYLGKDDEKDKFIKVYRGWGEERYYNNYIYGKNSYGEGGYVDGVGTYATDNEPNAWTFAKEDDKLFMEIAIPNNAKFISKEKLLDLHSKIYEEFNNNRDVYLKKYGDKVVDILDIMNENISSTAVLNGYEVIYNNDYRNWVILNRKILKIKKK